MRANQTENCILTLLMMRTNATKSLSYNKIKSLALLLMSFFV